MGVIVVLGAAVWPNGPSPTLRRRALHAAALWEQDQEAWVIGTGGVGKHPPAEATVIRDILVERGVAPEKIMREAHSTTTLENVKFALPMIRLLDAGKVTIVTDGYHAKRALMVAQHFGLDAQTSSPTLSTTGFADATRRHTRETFARLSYRAKLRNRPKQG